MTDMEFPFDDAPDTATITCCHVMEEKEPILYVAHDDEEDMCFWQFLCGKQHEESDARIVSLYSLYMQDKSIAELAKLPCGCDAERLDKDSEWVISRR